MPGKPNNMPWLSPYLLVKDVEKSVQFYEKAFGFKLRNIARDGSGTANHAELEYQDQVVMVGAEGEYEGKQYLSPASAKHPESITLYAYCEAVEQFCRHAEKAGAKVTLEPTEMPWGDLMCNLEDPDGYKWAFATNVKPCPDSVYAEE